MRKKGFTLVELLVVIAIIAMLLAILMPALAKVKTLAYQMLCGTNLKGVANAILVYTQDNNEKYPVAGPSGGTWNASGSNPAGKISWNWDEADKTKIVSTSKATVSACLYLLVKYADVSPSSFVCKASKQKKLNVTAAQDTTNVPEENSTAATHAKDATDCWDFSAVPNRYCSYSYAYPWSSNTMLSSASKAGVAVAGDLNPWIQPTTDAKAVGARFVSAATGTDAPQLITAVASGKATWTTGNTLTHELAGQNIMFNDMHVEFSKQPHPDSAIQNDNVYTPWDTTASMKDPGIRSKGRTPVNIGDTDVSQRPNNKEDSYLVQW